MFSSFDDITYNTKPIVKATGTTAGKRSAGADGAQHDSAEDDDDDNQDKNWENSDDDWTGPKSILRPQDVQATPSKRVRFELEEKENLEKTKNAASQNSQDSINNHAKIIREVLKKYPHLVKNNKNIRLKIMQKESKNSENATGKTKVSYVVLKSDHLMADGNNETDAKPCGTDGGEMGPWKCHKCDLDEEYHNYYMFRRHMQDVHDERFDPRVCEHCGYKATKRNILMYHLYTKHSVPPPKSMSFPKCHACNYIALSETLLVRHQLNHNHRPMTARSYPQLDEIQCVQCSLSFKDVNDLASHEMNTGHGSSINGNQKGFRCPHCHKVFVRSTNLHVHIDCAHKNLHEPEIEPPATIPLEPSSEAEALSNVASGIAASLGVGDTIITPDAQELHGDGNFLVSEMELNNIVQDGTYNGHEQMIMLIDNNGYQQTEVPPNQPQPQQLEISSNEQLVMQGTEEGMIVYIHGTDEHVTPDYVGYQHGEAGQEAEEIVEEVVEEVEEEVLEEQQGQTTTEENTEEHFEEVIQYVEEETEILEYDEEAVQPENPEVQESMMIIEEEHLERAESVEEDNNDNNKQKESQALADEWDEDSIEMAEIRLVNN